MAKPLDTKRFNSALADARLNLGVSVFKPSLHPRDHEGRFREALDALDPDYGRLRITPDITVVRSGDGFTLNKKGKGIPVARPEGVEDAAKAVHKHTDELDKPLIEGMDITPLEYYWLGKYQDASWSLNNNLRKGNQPRGRAKKIDVQLQALLAKNKTKRKMVVWRSLPSEVVKGHKPGETVSDPGYLSTAPKPEWTQGIGASYADADDSKKDLYKIAVPAGTPYIRDTFGGELIFDKNTTLRVDDISEQTVSKRKRRVIEVTITKDLSLAVPVFKSTLHPRDYLGMI